MHKALAKQLNLDARQEQQLKQCLEEQSWLYSDQFWKRALAIYGHALAGYLIFAIPFLFVFLIIASAG